MPGLLYMKHINMQLNRSYSLISVAALSLRSYFLPLIHIDCCTFDKRGRMLIARTESNIQCLTYAKQPM